MSMCLCVYVCVRACMYGMIKIVLLLEVKIQVLNVQSTKLYKYLKQTGIISYFYLLIKFSAAFKSLEYKFVFFYYVMIV